MDEEKFQRVNGTNYMTYGVVQDVAKHFDVMRNLRMREDDIICTGFPRTGNHWALEVIGMVMREEAEFGKTSLITSMFDVLGDGIEDKIDRMTSPRFFSTHYRIYRLPLEATKKHVKIVYLMRNPKDTMISHYRLVSKYTDSRFLFNGTWDEYFDLHINGEFTYGSWFDHVLAAERFIQEHPDHPIHVHCYEEMKLNPIQSIKALCAFLGKSEALAEKIADLTKFKNMKETLLPNRFQEEEDCFKLPAQALIGSGTIGGWKEYFSTDQNERFDQVFQEKMAGSNLAALISKYI